MEMAHYLNRTGDDILSTTSCMIRNAMGQRLHMDITVNGTGTVLGGWLGGMVERRGNREAAGADSISDAHSFQ